MKRKLSLVLISLLMIAVIAGCAAKGSMLSVAGTNHTTSEHAESASSQQSTTILPAVPQGPKQTISVMDLNVTSGLSPQEVSMLTDKLLNEFVNLKFYKVVERSKRDEILKEQGFQQSGACDQGACLVEAGQLLGVEKMIGGSIGKVGALYSVDLQMVDVRTGRIDMMVAV